MELLQGLTLRGRTLDLDGKKFVGCTFIDCVLQYSGGPVAFELSRFRGCRYVFYGSARNTVHFLQEVGLLPYLESDWGEFPERTGGNGAAEPS